MFAYKNEIWMVLQLALMNSLTEPKITPSPPKSLFSSCLYQVVLWARLRDCLDLCN